MFLAIQNFIDVVADFLVLPLVNKLVTTPYLKDSSEFINSTLQESVSNSSEISSEIESSVGEQEKSLRESLYEVYFKNSSIIAKKEGMDLKDSYVFLELNNRSKINLLEKELVDISSKFQDSEKELVDISSKFQDSEEELADIKERWSRTGQAYRAAMIDLDIVSMEAEHLVKIYLNQLEYFFLNGIFQNEKFPCLKKDFIELTNITNDPNKSFFDFGLSMDNRRLSELEKANRILLKFSSISNQNFINLLFILKMNKTFFQALLNNPDINLICEKCVEDPNGEVYQKLILETNSILNMDTSVSLNSITVIEDLKEKSLYTRMEEKGLNGLREFLEISQKSQLDYYRSADFHYMTAPEKKMYYPLLNHYLDKLEKID